MIASPVRGPTTTHDAWGAGHPRLIVTGDDFHHVFALDEDHVRIGSAEGCHLRLEGAAPLHAEVHHDGADEYVLVLHGPANTSTAAIPLPALAAEGEVLRTGAQFTIGRWRLVFARDESADHGRPYGGRAGGEGAHQRRQPPRPDYSEHHAA